MNLRIRLLVVTYKTPFDESETLNSVARYFRDKPSAANDFTLHVWDNSPSCRDDAFNVLSSEVPVNCIYTSTPENLALCSVYNRTINERSHFDYLCVLDQDTQLTDEYFDELQVLVGKKVNLALPQIYSNNFLYSPSHRKFCLGRHFSTIGAGPRTSSNMLAINSGMLIKSTVFDRIQYDERILFYGTDTWFMVQYQKNYAELHIMEAKLKHSLRIQQQNTASWRRNYYENQIAVNKIIFDNSIVERVVTWMYCKYLGIFHARR